jgi:hypothetical protein
MKRLLSNLFGTKNSSVRQQPSKHARLGVESLEDRRLMSAGYLDPSFAYSGVAKAAFDRGGSLYDSAEAVAIQSDGKIVVAGTVETSGGYDFAVTRFNPDGSPDFDFGSWSRTSTPRVASWWPAPSSAAGATATSA